MKYFIVKFGYNESDSISIDETELVRALKIQENGKAGLFNEGSISGNHIISITPDFNRAMGYNRGYKLTSEDYGCIPGNIIKEHRLAIEQAKDAVYNQIGNDTKQLN